MRTLRRSLSGKGETKTKMTYEEFCKDNFEELEDGDLIPKGLGAQDAFDILTKHFLGNVGVIGFNGSQEEWNAEIVGAILKLYPEGKKVRVGLKKRK